jgi:acetyl-CoA C-acetyltransferase
MGNALQTSIDALYGARHVGLKAGVPKEVGALTVNRLCGSGIQSIVNGAQMIRLGEARTVLAGGMENMSQAPFALYGARSGIPFGVQPQLQDTLFGALLDPLAGLMMAQTAEKIAKRLGITREAQDEYALSSLDGALRAQKEGWFDREIATVTVTGRKGEAQVSTDEQPRNARPDKIPTLKPAFRKDGTVTPANSSSISDGAAALVLMREEDANGHEVRARIVAHSSHAQKPSLFTTAPVAAIRKVLDKAGWEFGDVDLCEINEAFAVVPMAAMRELGIPRERLNVNGGACALGHPIGASGARIIVTLLHEMERRDAKRGVASLCIGGGEGTAVAIERL